MERARILPKQCEADDVAVDIGWRRPADILKPNTPTKPKVEVPDWVGGIKPSAEPVQDKIGHLPEMRPELDFPLVPPDWRPEPEKPPGSHVIEIKI